MEDLRVDVSGINEVISKLQHLLLDMEGARTTSRYETEIPPGALGNADFLQARQLHVAHSDMKLYLEAVVESLDALIDDYGTKTAKMRDGYSDQEYDIAKGMGGGSGDPGRPKLND
ncbi:hypothetical protein [Streptomyces luteolus]|uniref:PE domain-containing protein n=1 Tax=Streptomyces luteolus TaxID=3043615 RepID=A0ABT6SV86_9ACTN|nr:hypothetical protein [Streptomyces sp. B-S-A12]MDI3419504.1 hypothetical protein [Streptomyces sp. B-S-A12]